MTGATTDARTSIFYVRAGGEIVAFIVFHVPPSPGPLIVENLGVDVRTSRSTRAKLRRTLLHSVLEASETIDRPPNILAWATDNDERVPGIEALGFVSTKRPVPTDCQLRHYFEREFPAKS